MSVGLSCIATFMSMLNLRLRWDVHVSSVRWLFFLFFVYLFVWCTSRFSLYVWLTMLSRNEFVDAEMELTPMQLDRLGVNAVAKLEAAREVIIVAIAILGDVALFGYALSMFPLTYELWKIARKSMDRGIKREQERIRLYTGCIHLVLGLFLILEVAIVVEYGGYTENSHLCVLFVYCVQFVSLMFMMGLLFLLRTKGRKYESVQGVFVASPVYQRLKRIMLVYAFFSFQYQCAYIVVWWSEIENPTVMEFMGLSLFLYHASGLVLSITTGCSQSCIVSLCSWCMPEDVEAQFLRQIGQYKEYSLHDIEPPRVNPVFVFTDIEASSALWAAENGRYMQEATELHDDILRSTLAKYRGYEITTCGDAFQLAFHTIREAAEYCMDVQLQLLVAPWPKQIHSLVPATKRVRLGYRLVFNGLRVRMGIHDADDRDGPLVMNTHVVTGKMTYTGASQVIANEVGDLGYGGQILVTQRVAEWLRAHSESMGIEYLVEEVGEYEIPQVNALLTISQLLPESLEHRRKILSRTLRRRYADMLSYNGSEVRWSSDSRHRASIEGRQRVSAEQLPPFRPPFLRQMTV